jgi:hypothetical protein
VKDGEAIFGSSTNYQPFLKGEKAMRSRLKRFLPLIALFAVVGLTAQPVWAGLAGDSGYDVHETTMAAKTGKTYSGGMDLVYARIAIGSAAGRTRSFIKCEDGAWTGGTGIQVNMYDYKGNHVSTFAHALNPYTSVYAGALKVDPTPVGAAGDRVIWFSMTGGDAAEGDWYTVTVDADFSAVVTGPTARFSQPGNYEVEWHPETGQAFYAGKESNAWTDPHAIYIYTGSSLQKVVDVGGYSCGFAFDSSGNLYTGTYTDSGPATQQNVLMFTAAQVAAAISSTTPLTPAGATNTIAIPAPNGVFLGANDLESDPDGNIYLTANGGWDETYDSDVGYVFRIDSWNPSSPPSTMTRIAAGVMHPDRPDWQKALAYDGSSNLADGGHYDPTDPATQSGNRLYVDQDYTYGTGGPDTISGLAEDTDSDSDGVVDALDNAYMTSNANQVDADLDMYGNMADGDFDNDGSVGMTDFNYFKSHWLGSDPSADMDSDGSVGMGDFNLFKGRWLDAAPYY